MFRLQPGGKVIRHSGIIHHEQIKAEGFGGKIFWPKFGEWLAVERVRLEDYVLLMKRGEGGGATPTYPDYVSGLIEVSCGTYVCGLTGKHDSHAARYQARSSCAGHVPLCSFMRPLTFSSDAGTGTGAMSLFISRSVGPTGRVWTFDRRPEFSEQAKKNVLLLLPLLLLLRSMRFVTFLLNTGPRMERVPPER